MLNGAKFPGIPAGIFLKTHSREFSNANSRWPWLGGSMIARLAAACMWLMWCAVGELGWSLTAGRRRPIDCHHLTSNTQNCLRCLLICWSRHDRFPVHSNKIIPPRCRNKHRRNKHRVLILKTGGEKTLHYTYFTPRPRPIQSLMTSIALRFAIIGLILINCYIGYMYINWCSLNSLNLYRYLMLSLIHIWRCRRRG